MEVFPKFSGAKLQYFVLYIKKKSLTVVHLTHFNIQSILHSNNNRKCQILSNILNQQPNNSLKQTNPLQIKHIKIIHIHSFKTLLSKN